MGFNSGFKGLNTQQHKHMQDLCQAMPCTADHVQSQSKSSRVTKVSQSVSQSVLVWNTLQSEKWSGLYRRLTVGGVV